MHASALIIKTERGILWSALTCVKQTSNTELYFISSCLIISDRSPTCANLCIRVLFLGVHLKAFPH